MSCPHAHLSLSVVWKDDTATYRCDSCRRLVRRRGTNLQEVVVKQWKPFHEKLIAWLKDKRHET